MSRRMTSQLKPATVALVFISGMEERGFVGRLYTMLCEDATTKL